MQPQLPCRLNCTRPHPYPTLTISCRRIFDPILISLRHSKVTSEAGSPCKRSIG